MIWFQYFCLVQLLVGVSLGKYDYCMNIKMDGFKGLGLEVVS